MAQFLGWGNGHDGSVSLASGVINSYASATGAAGSSVLTTSLSASAGDIVLVHQTQGTNAGSWELVRVASVGSGVLNLTSPLVNSYGSGAQAVLVPQYTGGTCANSLTAIAWNGTYGGILALICSEELTLSGLINTTGQGYRGGVGGTGGVAHTQQGEGYLGTGSSSTSANGNGGGGGGSGPGQNGSNPGAGGGGGGNGTTGANTPNVSYGSNTAYGATGGGTFGNSSLTTMTFGGGGGSGGSQFTQCYGNEWFVGGTGGAGGGLILLIAKKITITGTITANGGNGASSTTAAGGGGGGAGGSILIKSQVANLGTNKITATGGAGGSGGSRCGATGGNGGAGGSGRIHLDYLTSYSGTTNPTIDVSQDNGLKIKSGASFLFNLV